ncbi:unnamed protein product [Pleuronectes platessa]|uniref:Uncharacterized protein n=1 Tax=Pleuronectes platessa TaxID=8262 RepID=A0A9N7UTR9_PLEPL|nr:unnamed protein product [Pleuronectes platessa]
MGQNKEQVRAPNRPEMKAVTEASQRCSQATPDPPARAGKGGAHAAAQLLGCGWRMKDSSQLSEDSSAAEASRKPAACLMTSWSSPLFLFCCFFATAKKQQTSPPSRSEVSDSETDQWPAGLGYCPGAMLWQAEQGTGTKLRRGTLLGLHTAPPNSLQIRKQATAPAAVNGNISPAMDGQCVLMDKAQPLVLNPFMTGHSSTVPCKNMVTLSVVRRPQNGQSDMAFLIDRELSCCQLDAGLLSISGRPLPGPSPSQTRQSRSLTVAITPTPLPSRAAQTGTRSYCPLFATASHASARPELDTLQTA